ncbi:MULTISPECIES: tetratricopeptide repeat protein [unclassified Cryobacterium]|uniref:tetratricopeptide repeat protein n=1 Tax=unclassified Cryobacterium TaxID=2649013 RepID=UPI000CE3C9A3|nr:MULTISPECIES: tetratricopeptide repeat protein [unclassified Cryobacterium]
MANWEERIRGFWLEASDADADAILGSMQILVAERDNDDPAAIYEWASVQDFLGREAEAIPFYRRALDLGLDPVRRSQALIQLASSLRNIGETTEAIKILEGVRPDPTIGDAGEAFLALSLFDAGRPGDALRVALKALGKTLPLYHGVVDQYADAIVDPSQHARRREDSSVT